MANKHIPVSAPV
jgi:dipeptidyl-peptidase-3